ncbi:hypothetical protein [Prosthecobacter fusiformis]|nr:hypothetical protein [Prosthecobacter fusiformis]
MSSLKNAADQGIVFEKQTPRSLNLCIRSSTPTGAAVEVEAVFEIVG